MDDATALSELAELQTRLDATRSGLLVVRCSFDDTEIRPILRSAPAVGLLARSMFVECLRNLAAGYRIGLQDYRDGVSVRLAQFDVDADGLHLSFVGSHKLELDVALDETAADRTGGLAFAAADTLADLAGSDSTRHRI